jgi:hypothetical protein
MAYMKPCTTPGNIYMETHLLQYLTMLPFNLLASSSVKTLFWFHDEEVKSSFMRKLRADPSQKLLATFWF